MFSCGEGCHLSTRVVSNGLGSVRLGAGVSLGYRLAPRVGNGAILLQARKVDSLICIGDRTEMSNNISIISLNRILIGEDCLISDLVSISDSDFHDQSPLARRKEPLRRSSDGLVGEVRIADNVWIGSRSIVLRGSIIGMGSIVGAGSVVKGEIPSGVLAAGVPARVIRRL